MANNSLLSGPLYAGTYTHAGEDVGVTLQSCGDRFEVVALKPLPAALSMRVEDGRCHSAVFRAPRAGADRYPDWAQVEWQLRLGETRGVQSRVWRVAEDTHWALFLGQAAPVADGPQALTLAAALWRGWCRRRSVTPMALFWQADSRAHLWLVRPFDFPRYRSIAGVVTPESVALELQHCADARNLTLELGRVSPGFQEEIARLFPCTIRPVEPFTDLMVTPEVRRQVLSSATPDVYLPALGAARTLAGGAPEILSLCGSSQAVAVADG